MDLGGRKNDARWVVNVGLQMDSLVALRAGDPPRSAVMLPGWLMLH